MIRLTQEIKKEHRQLYLVKTREFVEFDIWTCSLKNASF